MSCPLVRWRKHLQMLEQGAGRCRAVALISPSSWKPWGALGTERASKRICEKCFAVAQQITATSSIQCLRSMKETTEIFWLFFHICVQFCYLIILSLVLDGCQKFWVPRENPKMSSHNDPTFFVLHYVQRLSYFHFPSCLFTLPAKSKESSRDHKTVFFLP